MNQPIAAGCRAVVIDGARGKASPNVGLIVRVLSFRGEHSQFGRIWRCEAEFAELHQEGRDVPPGHADFAQSWLRRLPDETQPPKAAEVTEETPAC